MMQDERGFAFTFLVVLLPIIFSLLCGLSVSWIYLQQWTKHQHTCRTSLLQIQGQMKGELEDLLRLNPQAQRLRKERKLAQAALTAALASGNPAAVTQARAYLKLVKARQLRLNMQQRKHLIKAHHLRRQALAKFTTRSRLTSVETSVHHGTFYGLAVYPSPIQSLSPDYKTQPFFTQKQSIHLEWRVSMLHWLPSWVPEESIVSFAQKIKSECAASIRKRRSKWFAVPIKARSF